MGIGDGEDRSSFRSELLPAPGAGHNDLFEVGSRQYTDELARRVREWTREVRRHTRRLRIQPSRVGGDRGQDYAQRGPSSLYRALPRGRTAVPAKKQDSDGQHPTHPDGHDDEAEGRERCDVRNQNREQAHRSGQIAPPR